ncbi:MAG: NADH-quinone oxidoreductase subunit C [Planctomycetota bacterium]|nr:NADH-quinone oxidoreductase subunit C [Planctomycetota bacterium]
MGTSPGSVGSTASASSAAARLQHPTFAIVKNALSGRTFRGTEFRGQSTLVVEPRDLHDVLSLLKTDPRCDYNFLSDVIGIDYLSYPALTVGRFAVIYNLISFARDDRFFVKTFLNPSLPTEGVEVDPALELDTVCDLWPGAEWPEREVFDMFGIRFRNHPDLRRILTWEDYPGHPLRKDYPLRGRGERETYKVVDRTTT